MKCLVSTKIVEGIYFCVQFEPQQWSEEYWCRTLLSWACVLSSCSQPKQGAIGAIKVRWPKSYTSEGRVVTFINQRGMATSRIIPPPYKNTKPVRDIRIEAHRAEFDLTTSNLAKGMYEDSSIHPPKH